MSLLASVNKPQTLTPTTSYAVKSLVRGNQHCHRHHGNSTQHARTNRYNGLKTSSKKHTPANRRCVTIEDSFINSLVVASSCSDHKPENWARTVPSHRPSITSSRPNRLHSGHVQERRFSSHAATTHSPQRGASERRLIPREEYLELVNTYTPFGKETKRSREIAKRRLHSLPQYSGHFPLASRLVMTAEQEEASQSHHFAFQYLPPLDERHARQILELQTLLRSGHPGYVSHSEIGDFYERLPTPRPCYLSSEIIDLLFRHLSRVEFKSDHDNQRRFFAVFNECVENEIPLTQRVWNSAIAYTGRWMRRAHQGDIKSAVETWLRMERAGETPNHVTFNILFDVAVKSGRFALAEVILSELQARGLQPNRFWRTGMVYFYGLRHDGDAVRHAFRELVNAGEIIDTTVMNCVIVSLVRSGEVAAAENVLMKMKLLHEKQLGVNAPPDWRETRRLGIILDKTASMLRNEGKSHEATFFGGSYSTEDKREELQKLSPIAPDAETYRILIVHHARISGNWPRVLELLDEVRARGLGVHGSVYFNIFIGFRKHGGYAYSRWDRESLEGFWAQFLSARSPAPSCQAVSSPKAKASHSSSWIDDIGDDDSNLAERLEEEFNSFHDDELPAATPDEDKNISEFDRAPYFTFNLVLVILQAFHQCAGRRRMLEIWEAITQLWADMPAGDREIFNKLAAGARQHTLFDWPAGTNNSKTL